MSDPQTYKQMDVGELCGLMFTVPDEELEAIKKAGLLLGHYGVVERAYEVMNERALRANGASENDILAFNAANLERKHDAVLQIAEHYGVQLKSPSRTELSEGLRHAIGVRGFSIDDLGSSVGTFYQALFGKDFEGMSFNVTDKQSGLPVKLPYSSIPSVLKPVIHRIILQDKGYQVVQSQL